MGVQRETRQTRRPNVHEKGTAAEKAMEGKGEGFFRIAIEKKTEKRKKGNAFHGS